MVTEQEKTIALEYLADKTIKGVWVNSAGELFFDEGLAKASDEDAEFIRKPAQKEVKKADSDKKDNQSKDVQNPPSDNSELKEKNLKILAELELKKENYQSMKALVKFFEIKTENNSADTFITALTQFKETLKPV